MQTQGVESAEDGFSAYMITNADRGYATVQISFRSDETLDVEQAASFLCGDCLQAVLSEIYEIGSGVGIINFETREIQALEPRFTGFSLGDYYIHCDWNPQLKTADTQDVGLLVSYHPPRYAEE